MAGEEVQTVDALNYARDIMIQVLRNEKVLKIGSHGHTQTFDNTITDNIATPVNNKSGDAKDLILLTKTSSLKLLLVEMDQYPTFAVPTNNDTDCIDDIKDIIEVVAHNLAFGGNDRTWDAANLYATGQHVSGEETQIYMLSMKQEI